MSVKPLPTMHLQQLLPWSLAVESSASTSVLFVPKNLLKTTLEILNLHSTCQYKMLSDITAVDWLGQEGQKIQTNKLQTFASDPYYIRYFGFEGRFVVTYMLLSVVFGRRLLIKTFVSEQDAQIESVCDIYRNATWYERETWDMFGIVFSQNPDLRRILTDYGFEGHPLRKDFPLSGYTEVRFDISSKRIVTDNLELPQEFRYYDLESPWEKG